MTKDFSNPHKLGFMRLIQIMFAINVVISITSLAFLIKGEYTLTFEQMLNMLNLIFDGISFWLIWKRMRSARMFIIAFSLFNIIVGTFYNLATGSFDIVDQAAMSLFDIILLIYFLTSRRAKTVLVNSFSAEADTTNVAEERDFYQLTSWAFWCNILIYFCVFSVVGHWAEAGYCTLIRFGLIPGTYNPDALIWTDWLYPFLVYGFGAVVCVLLLYPLMNYLREHIRIPFVPLLISFIVNSIICTLIELVMGLILNQPGADGTMPLWDYSDMFCNFMGQICLQNGLAFGFISTLITWVVYPSLESLFAKIPANSMNVAFIVVLITFGILFVLQCINIPLSDSFGVDGEVVVQVDDQ
jgi:uncharacterized membrane protein